MHCPICRYNLRDLAPAALCPECGSTPEQRAAALAQRPRFVIPVTFAATALISVGQLALMARGSIHPAFLPVVFFINTIPFVAAWGVLVTAVRPKSKREAMIAALPPALAVLAILTLAYWDSFVRHLDAQSSLILFFTPAFTIPIALLACILSWAIVRLTRALVNQSKIDR